MPKANSTAITAIQARNHKEGVLSDGGPYRGLRLEVLKSGAKVWTYRFRSPVDGKLRQMKLGDFSQMSLQEARKKLGEMKALRDEGIDPAIHAKSKKEATKREQMAKKVMDYTVTDMCHHYLEEHIERNRKLKGQKEVRRILTKNIINEPIGKKSATELTAMDVNRAMEKVIRRGAPVVGGSTIRELRLAFEHAVSSGRIPEIPNPCDRVKTPSNGKRKRFLTDWEIGELMRWLPESGLSKTIQDVLKLILFTGCRGGEVTAMKWSDVDLINGVWHIQENKTDVPRNVQLSPQAIEVLESRSRDAYPVFPVPNNPKKSIVQNALGTALAVYRKSCKLEHWTPHDLRRTVRTGLSKLKDSKGNRCPNEVAEAILGHSRKGIEGVYDLHGYEDDCRHWLKEWGKHVDIIVNGAPVVSLDSRRKS